MYTSIVVICLVGAIALGQTSLHPMEKDPNSVDGRPLQTDKILLKDGSEKRHLIKKPKETPHDSSTPSPAGLPTDVD